MSFKDGFRLGSDIGIRRREMALAEERDKRAAEEFQWRKDEVARLGQARAREDAAFSSLENVQRGLSTDTQGQIKQTYGMTPQQISAAGDGLQTKLASYDQPDSYDLQSAPATGVQPRFTADQVKTQPATRLEMERAIGGVALAKRDLAGYQTSLKNQREIQNGEEDSQFALSVVQDPTGEAARNARMFVNTNSRRLSSKVDPKTGMTTFALVNGDGYDEIKVPPADLGKIAVGYRRLQRGDVGGLDVIAAVNKDLAAAVSEELKINLDIGKANNDANYKSGSLANDAARTRAVASNAQRTSQNVREFVDAKGNTVLLDIAGLAKNPDGSLAVPAGLRPKTARAEVTTANIIDYAKSLVEGGAADPDAPNKPLTLDKAMVIARAQLGGDGYKTAADRLVEAYIANRAGGPQPAATQAAPAQGVRVPSRQITTIVPPRSAADLAPRQPATEEDIIKMLAR